MSERLAYAKINLALVVGPSRPDGKHEVTTVLQRIGLADRIRLERTAGLVVEGFEDDTLVRRALELIAGEAGVAPYWRAVIDKQIPVAAGLGGGSSDAAAALELANEALGRPVADARLYQLAADLGADVPFFLARGPQLGEGDGTVLTALELRQAFTVLVLLPEAESKASTGDVYAEFDARGGSAGYEGRREPASGGASGRKPRRPAAERPRSVPPSGGVAPARRLPGRRLRGRAGRLRAVRRRVVRRGREAPD